jgi:transcriptional regulator with XRE-family HTH domain
MHGISATETPAADDTLVRLRRDVYDRRVTELGATTVRDQASLTGVAERSLYRIRRGDPPSIGNAVRMAKRLSVPFDVLFERVEG